VDNRSRKKKLKDIKKLFQTQNRQPLPLEIGGIYRWRRTGEKHV
jgi:hypothetical protein